MELKEMYEWWDAVILEGKGLMVKSTIRGYETYNVRTKETYDSTDDEIKEYKTIRNT
jgi:hypothetical protein